jgi:P27 family predicted phage terminase small subunit
MRNNIKEQIIIDLQNRGLFESFDIQLVDLLAYNIELEKELREQLKVEGYIYTDPNGQKRRNPVSILHRSIIETIQGLSKTLGVFPLNRQKVKSEKYIPEEDDIYNELIKG